MKQTTPTPLLTSLWNGGVVSHGLAPIAVSIWWDHWSQRVCYVLILMSKVSRGWLKGWDLSLHMISHHSVE